MYMSFIKKMKKDYFFILHYQGNKMRTERLELSRDYLTPA